MKAACLSKWLLPGAAGLLAAVLGVRLVWVASRTESGWETLRQSWRDATWGRFSGRETGPMDGTAAEQADFWLAEIDRVLAARGETAELVMGAAWVLDSPFYGTAESNLPGINPAEFAQTVARLPFTRRDENRVGASPDDFDRRCGQRCLALAARATELEPENVEWWRMRAMLQWRRAFDKPRNPDWLAVLDECAKHDPDNALYDYLAVIRLCDGAIDESLDSVTGLRRSDVKDRDRIRRAAARFEAGLRKKQYSTYGKEVATTAAFLRWTSLPICRQAEIADARRRRLLDVFELCHCYRKLIYLKVDQQQREQALLLARRGRAVVDQLRRGGPQSDRAVRVVVFDMASSNHTCVIANNSPKLLTSAELAALNERGQQALVRAAIWQRAQDRTLAAQVKDGSRKLSIITTTALAHAGFVLLLLVGLACWVVSLILGRKGTVLPRLGAIRHFLAWLTAFGVTFCILGIVPSGVLRLGATRGMCWPTTIGVWVFAGILLGFIFAKARSVFRRWSEQPAQIPVISLVAVVTLWQLAIVLALGVTADPLTGPVEWLRDQLAAVDGRPAAVGIWLLLAIPASLLPAAALWARSLLTRSRARRGPSSPGLRAIALLLPVTVVGIMTFVLSPEFLIGLLPTRELDYGLYWYGADPGWQEARLVALSQFAAYGGLYASSAFALVVVALWYARRLARSNPEASRPARWSGVFRCVGRSALAAAMLCLLLYLAFAPRAIRITDDYYADRSWNSEAAWQSFRSEVDVAMEQIENDPTMMKPIEQEAANRFSRLFQ